MVKRYKKIKIVGEGSYSKCWLVRTVNSDSEYVAKIIPKSKLELLVKEKVSLFQFSLYMKSEYISSCLIPMSCISTTGLRIKTISTSSWNTVRRA